MKFYESIAEYYEFIFDPEDSAEIIDGLFLGPGSRRIIDIGCATGKLSAGFAALKHDVTGIDLDAKMIEIARERYSRKGLNLNFACENMLNITNAFERGYFGAAVCVGNTIVHLDGASEIEEFFRALNLILSPGAVFVGQILNYDRIMSKKIDKLALIENDKIKFERYYDLDTLKNKGKIIFKTKLTVKGNGAVIENEAPLYPAKKQEIFGALTAAGFTDINFYSDIEKGPFSIENSGPLAFGALKA